MTRRYQPSGSLAAAIAIVILLIAMVVVSLATPVRFSITDQYGTYLTNTVTIVPRPSANPTHHETNLLVLTTLVTNVPGQLIVNLYPWDYTITLQGSLNELDMKVLDTNVVVDATSLITNLVTYTYTNVPIAGGFTGNLTVLTNGIFTAIYHFFDGLLKEITVP